MASPEIPTNIFVDPARAERHLHALHEMFFASASLYPIEEFSGALREQLLASPDPDMALNNLLRFAEAVVSKASLFNDLVHYPVVMEVVMRIFGFSQYFADIMVRDPELLRWLTASDSLVKPRTREYLAGEAARILQMFQRPEKSLDALKRLYRREVLRIGARDVLGEADIPTITQELSNLADVVINASCIVAGRQMEQKYPHPPSAAFAVVGLGKLGGGELNYSSDVDIILVYETEGEIRDAAGKKVTYHEYFNKFAERMIQNLSQSTAEGYLYRVDTRLRPESGAGPLARSVQSYLLYYESRGELWERQMLIKARLVGGDGAFGQRFLQQLTPFIYPRTFIQHPVTEIARIKARIEAANVGAENIKVRAGGIRDIEFIVQALQLVNGGKHTGVRSGNTLQAINQLAAQHLLSEGETVALTRAYIFYRTLEHRLQIMFNTQTHTVPSDVAAQTRVARQVGLASAEELQRVSADHLRAVRNIFDTVMMPEAGPKRTDIAAIVMGGAQGESMAEVFQRYRFEDPQLAAKNVSILLSGSSLTQTRDLDARAREAFRTVAEDLFKEISATPSPDMTLQNLTSLIAAQKFQEQFYEQSKEVSFRKFVLAVCSVSPRFTKRLARDPLLLETLAANPVLAPLFDVPKRAGIGEIVRMKNTEEVRAGVRNILGATTLDDLSGELTRLADVIVKELFAREIRKRRLEDPHLAVFALGKYGTSEIIFDADLDLLFVDDSQEPAVREKLHKLASGLLSSLAIFHEQGRLYDVDARLRPEGRNAPLVVEAATYGGYLAARASLWERQSLTRLRFVCGDGDLGKRVTKLVESFVYGSPLPKAWTDTIVAMRRKVETRSRTRTDELVDLKLGPGGIVDIEFLAQMIQLKFGEKHPALRSQSTTGVLTTALDVWLNAEDVSFFTSAYALLRQLENLIRITLEERGTVLPEGKKLDLLARCYDGSSGLQLRSRVGSIMSSVRTRFLALSQMLSKID
jgi:glutamate-ammonia-ligase adenylyltransferase